MLSNWNLKKYPLKKATRASSSLKGTTSITIVSSTINVFATVVTISLTARARKQSEGRVCGRKANASGRICNEWGEK